MLVMPMSGVYAIPSHYILKRWMMEDGDRAQLAKLNVKDEGDRPKSRVQCFNALLPEIHEICRGELFF